MKRTLLISFALCIGLTIALQAQDKTAIDYNNEGNGFLTDKKYSEALDSYSKAVELWSDTTESTFSVALYNAGYSGYKAKSYGASISFFERAAALDYKAGSAYYYAGICAWQDKNYSKAIENFQKNIDLQDEKAGSSYKYLAYSYLKLDDSQNYEATLRKGINASDLVSQEDIIGYKELLAKYLYSGAVKAQNANAALANTDTDTFKSKLESEIIPQFEEVVQLYKPVEASYKSQLAAKPGDADLTKNHDEVIDKLKTSYNVLKNSYQNLAQEDKVIEIDAELSKLPQ